MASLSIVIPTFNSVTTFGRCLASVRSHGIRDVEVLVVDNLGITHRTTNIASLGASVIVSPTVLRIRDHSLGVPEFLLPQRSKATAALLTDPAGELTESPPSSLRLVASGRRA